MANPLIRTIYDRTLQAALAPLDGDMRYAPAYFGYLENKYGDMLDRFSAEEDEKFLRAATELFVGDELREWGEQTRDSALGLLEEDPAFGMLTDLSEHALNQAMAAAMTGTFLSDEAGYREASEQAERYAAAVKPFHADAAKEILSETLLDINFAYHRSELKSLRLARIV